MIIVITNGSYIDDSFAGCPPPAAKAAGATHNRTAPIIIILYTVLFILLYQKIPGIYKMF
jgi:hypothetical protein